MHTPFPPSDLLPPDDPARRSLHNEVHARPSPRVRLPALLVYVAVLNEGVTREDELRHLRELPGQGGLTAAELGTHFALLELPGAQLQWERHTEFTRYAWIQPLPADTPVDADAAALMDALPLARGWLRHIPGRTLAAIKLVMVKADLADPHAVLAQARRGFSEPSLVASLVGGHGHSCAVTDFQLRPSGFERMRVVTQPDTTPTRAGRVTQRLLELETYRLMALRGLPAAKALGPTLAQIENELSQVTAQLEDAAVADRDLLDRLTALAARVERATADNAYRFSATQAYDAIVRQRIAELRERPIQGTQTIGEFMQRRLSPAMATVSSTAQRLATLSERIARASALLRTRVDIATETQNQQLLAQLTRGQELQLQLQSTVEGLSIAAISYYVVSLVLYAAKAAQKIGLPIQPELAAGLSIPVVLWAVWRTVRHIHAKLHHGADGAAH